VGYILPGRGRGVEEHGLEASAKVTLRMKIIKNNRFPSPRPRLAGRVEGDRQEKRLIPLIPPTVNSDYSIRPTASLTPQIVWPKPQIRPWAPPLSSLAPNLQSEGYRVAWAPSHPLLPLPSHRPKRLFPFSPRPGVECVSVD